jgi:hypothetical protein
MEETSRESERDELDNRFFHILAQADYGLPSTCGVVEEDDVDEPPSLEDQEWACKQRGQRE